MPTCPEGYSCTFTLLHAHTIVRHSNPWWQLTAGWVVALVAVLVLGCVIAYVSYLAHMARQDARVRLERERQRQNDLAMEEQRTMQAEQAKGNPELLKMIRSGNRY